MNYDRQDLIEAVKKDDNAFERLYKSIYPDLYKLALYNIGNHHIAEDIVSETIMDAYVGIHKLKDTNSFQPWIIKILITKCKRKHKYKFTKFTTYNPNAVNISDIDVSSSCSNYIEELTDIGKAICRLSTEDNLIVTLCIIEGYTSTQVGKILSLNASTVRSRLNRALTKIKKDLED